MVFNISDLVEVLNNGVYNWGFIQPLLPCQLIPNKITGMNKVVHVNDIIRFFK